MNNKETTLTALVPVYNEEKMIHKTLATLSEARALSEKYFEIVVINDGSTDLTGEFLAELKKIETFDVVTLPNNQGIGNAIRNGIEHTRTEKFFIVPGDNDLTCSAICSLVLNSDKSEMVIGYYPENSIHRPRYRKQISKMYTKLLNFMTNSSLPYVNCPGVYKTAYARNSNLRRSGYVFIAELSLKMLHKSRDLSVVPLATNETTHLNGNSLSLKTLRELLKFVSSLYFGKDRWIRQSKPAQIVLSL